MQPPNRITLLLATVLLPCVLSAALGLWMLEQERELEEKRAVEEQVRRTSEFRQSLLASLERIKLQAVANRGKRSARSTAVVLVAVLRNGRLVLPWEEPDGRQQSSENLRKGEQEELGGGSLERAVAYYRAAIAARSGAAEEASARLLLARASQRMGRRLESRQQYEAVSATPTHIRDEHAIPIAFYALAALAQRGELERKLLSEVITAGLERDDISPAGWHLACDLVRSSESSAQAALIAKRIQEVDRAETLQAGFGDLLPLLRMQEGNWISIGDPEWLIGLIPPVGGLGTSAMVVSAEEVLTKLGVAASRDGVVEAIPGLRISLPSVPADTRTARRTFLAISVLIILLLTCSSGYLLWRGVQREASLTEVRSQFVASVSHELKTPLAAIRLHAEALSTGDNLGSDVQSEYLATIVAESERLSRLVDNVLEFGRIEQGKKMYHFRSTELTAVASGAARALARPMAELNFQMQILGSEDTLPVRADPDALQQAILNLLTNAMKYSGGSKEIRMEMRREDKNAVLHVIDHGIGIPEQERDRIFERYYRVQNAQVPGAGLGLTLAAHVVQAHGGTIAVTSHPGVGSTFSIRLPLEVEE